MPPPIILGVDFCLGGLDAPHLAEPAFMLGLLQIDHLGYSAIIPQYFVFYNLQKQHIVFLGLIYPPNMVK